MRVFRVLLSALFVVQSFFWIATANAQALPSSTPLDYEQIVELTAVGQQQTHDFIIPSEAEHDGWRLAVEGSQALQVTLTNLTTEVTVYSNVTNAHTFFFKPEDLTAGDNYRLTMRAHYNGTTTYTAASEGRMARAMAWDAGTANPTWQTMPQTIGGFSGGDWIFKIERPQLSLHGMSRFVLVPQSGSREMHLSVYNGSLDNIITSSSAAGTDVLHINDQSLPPAATVYVRVNQAATTNPPNWQLLAGDIHVQDLGELAASPSANARKIVGHEGVFFFKTAVNDEVPAWQLMLTDTNEASYNHTVYVRKNAPALPSQYDRYFQRYDLVVPDYLSSGTYFMTVRAPQGTTIDLRSQIQPIENLSFTGSVSNVSVAALDFPYRVYRVDVPVDQIGWQPQLQSLAGNADLFVRKSKVGNRFNNDGLSEAPSQILDTVTHVPPMLASGAWYVTTFGQGAYQFNLSSGNPTVTDIAFVNDTTPVSNGSEFENQAGWRFYRVSNIDSQLGNLGWELRLANQFANTQIAIRRNAVPSIWQYRTSDSDYIHSSQTYDAQSASGTLYRPGHQADVWYVGVYNPGQLGPFTLRTTTSQPPTLNFNSASTSVTEQHAQDWRYFKVTVPDDAAAWELALTNVSGAQPMFVVARDKLPIDRNTTPNSCGPSAPTYICKTWASGHQLASTLGFANRYYEDQDNAINIKRRDLVMGRNNPLEPGVYYIGVTGEAWNATGTMNYTITSRGVGGQCGGSPCTVQVQALDFGATASATISQPHDSHYYTINVPEALDGTVLQLTNVVGESNLSFISAAKVPNSYAGWNNSGYSDDPRIGNLLNTNNEERAYFYHENWYNPATNQYEMRLRSGVHTFVVTSQGANQRSNAHIGSGSVSYQLSLQAVAIDDKRDTPLSPSASLTWANQSLTAGEIKTYRLNVPAGISNMEVRLESVSGKPMMAMHSAGDGAAYLPVVYSYQQSETVIYGGASAAWNNELLNVVAPTGDYTVSVLADANQAAEFSLVVEPKQDTQVGFNNGNASVTGQAPNTWRYFEVTVPKDAMAWEISLENVSGGSPALVIRKALQPDSTFNPNNSNCGSNSPLWFCNNWLDGEYIVAAQHFVQRYTNADGTQNRTKHALIPMGAPLQPGTYYVGVTAESTSVTEPLNYTMRSRGVGHTCGGVACNKPVQDIPYNAVTNTVISTPQDAAYFRVQVPEGEAGWALQLNKLVGDAMMGIRYGHLPSSAMTSYASDDSRPVGNRRDGPAGEYFYKMAPAAGDYYIAVGAAGAGAPNMYTLGAGSTEISLASGPYEVRDVTATPLEQGDELTWPEQSLRLGESRSYRVRVPEGLSNMEVRLRGVVGAMPIMTLRRDDEGAAVLPAPRQSSSYGSVEGGDTYSAYSYDGIMTVADPAGDYTLTVVVNTGATEEFEVAFVARGEQPLAFNNGSARVDNQESLAWRYFVVDVPSNAVGWELSLENVSGDRPVMVIGRNKLPTDLTSLSAGCGRNQLYQCDNWPEGGVLLGNHFGYGQRNNYVDNSEVRTRRVQLGMNTPLEPGTYYVGVRGDIYQRDQISYTIVSRGIGTECGGELCTRQVVPLTLTSALTAELAQPGDAHYYRVAVPEGSESLRLDVEPTVGDVMLAVQHNKLPNSFTPSIYTGDGWNGGVRRDAPGADYFYRFPADIYNPETQQYEYRLQTGDYYFAVSSLGDGMEQSYQLGSGAVSYRLRTGPVNSEDMREQPLTADAPIRWENQQLNFGEVKVYRVRVPETILGAEVRLLDRTGNPLLAMVTHPADAPELSVPAYQAYSEGRTVEGGSSENREHPEVLNITKIEGDLAITVVGSRLINEIPTSSFTVQVSAIGARNLAFAGGVYTNQTRANAQQHLYKVEVPEAYNGEKLFGWQLDTEVVSGNVSVRVNRGSPPDSAAPGVTPRAYNERQVVISAPYLQPGTWYVEVTAQGGAEYNIRSNPVQAQAVWSLPTTEQSGVFAGDSGPVDLGQNRMHFYRIEVPEGNNGLIAAELIKISGEADMFLRFDSAPSAAGPVFSYNERLYDRENTNANSQYSNWTVKDGREDYVNGELQLKPGTWWLGVKARDSNARYQLRVSNGNVREIPIAGGGFSNETLVAQNFRYYKVQVPDSSTTLSESTPEWTVRLTQVSGDVLALIREHVPPGDGDYTSPYSHISWVNDNQYQSHRYVSLEEGELTIGTDIVKPGATYYVGVYARNDAQFDIAVEQGSERLRIDAHVSVVGGTREMSMPANSSRVVKVTVPTDTEMYRHEVVTSGPVDVLLMRDRLPSLAESVYHHRGGYYGNGDTFEQRLINRDLSYNYYPWQPVGNFYMELVNSSSEVVTATVTMAGYAYEPDVAPPVFGNLPDVFVEATGLMTPFAPGGVYAQDDYDGSVLATTDFTGPLAMGVHVMTWTAVDTSGNASTATQNVIVADTTAPTVTAPDSISMEATGPTTAVELGAATAVDVVSGDLVAVPDNAGPFAPGYHTVVWTAVDAAGNTGMAWQSVTITDTTPPVITGVGMVTISTNDTAGVTADNSAVVEALDAVVADDLVAGSVEVTSDIPWQLPVGSTTVQFTATDSWGNQATFSMVINVVYDDQPPVLTVPERYVIELTTRQSLLLSDERVQAYLAEVVAIDALDGNVTVRHNLPAEIPFGRTVVQFVAEDQAGNTAAMNGVLILAIEGQADRPRRRGILLKILGEL